MARLRDLAKLIRSKNAGPFELTFDVMFADRATYDRVVASRVLAVPNVSRLLGVDADSVQLFEYAAANAIKITVPRFAVSGDARDTDLFGGQQFAPLVDLVVD